VTFSMTRTNQASANTSTGKLTESLTSGQSDLAKAVPNDPAHIARAAELSRVTDRQTDCRTDAAHIGNNSLHLIMNVKTRSVYFLVFS